MNRNTIVGSLLIFAILIGYYFWMAPSPEEIESQRNTRDSLAMVKRIEDSIRTARARELQQAEAERPEAVAEPRRTVETEATMPPLDELREKYGMFAMAAQGQDEIYYIENEVFRIGVSTLGGSISYVELKEYKTWDSLPLILIDADSNSFGFLFFAGNRSYHTKQFYFQPVWYDAEIQGEPSMSISGDDQLKFGMRLYAGDEERYIEFLYTVEGNDYMLNYDVRFVNLAGLIDNTREYIDLEWNASLRHQEKSVDRFNGATIYYNIEDEGVDYLSETKDDEETLRDRLKWASFKQPFFSSVLIADQYFIDPILRTFTDENPSSDRYLKSTYMKVGVPYMGLEDEEIGMQFYFGPNKYSVMKKYDLDLERQIPLGWSFFLLQWINRYAVIPVFNYLGSFGWNYGIVILVLTILLKTVLFPIAYKTYKSSAKMRVLKPEIEELNEKYPKKEDAMKKQQAMMALYKKAGANPMSGCIPMLLQLPILIALFRFFPASIELRQESFLWADDLSSYDSILDLPFSIPFYGDHVSLFTLLMTISTLIYTHMNSQMMSTGSQQMPGMKTMMYLMPIMFLGIFNNYASGLSYYYFLVNVITFAQMYLFRLTVNEEKIHRKIQEHKKKPVKKSAFQRRLEEAAKKRGYNPNQLRK